MLVRLQQGVHADGDRADFHRGKVGDGPFRAIERQDPHIVAEPDVQTPQGVTELVDLVGDLPERELSLGCEQCHLV